MFFVALFPTFAVAQGGDFFRNSFVSLGAGPSYYAGSLGASAQAGFGKWVISTTAFRGIVDVNFVPRNAGMQTYYYGHADLMVDVFSALKGRNPSDNFRSYLLLGGGIVHTQGDNDFCATIGAGLEYRFSENWRLYCEIAALAHPSEFDNNESATLLSSLSVGVVYDIASNPTRSRSRFETKSLADDWFFNIALGGCSVNYGDIGSFSERLSLLTPNFEFGIGKRLTSFWQIRLCASGLYAKTVDDYFSFYNVRGDIMIDPVSYFFYDKYNPRFLLRPYLGAGVVARLDNQSNFLVTASAGMQLVWRADKRNQIYLDGRYSVTPPRFVSTLQNQRIGSVGLLTLMLGYSHTFTRVTLR